MMSEESEAAIMNFGEPDREIRFTEWKQLRRWLEREHPKWDWLVRGDGNTDVFNRSTSVHDIFDSLANQFAQWDDQKLSITTATDALGEFGIHGSLFASESAGGSLVLEIKESAGEAAASFAYSFLKGQVTLGNVTRKDQLLGAVLTVIPDVRHPAELSDRLQRERANYRSASRSLMTTLDQNEAKRAQAAAVTLKGARRFALRVFRHQLDTWSTRQADWEQGAIEAVTGIRKVENTFREQMGLQAPVEYWKSKGAAHGVKEGKAVKRLVWFFPIALGILAATFGLAGWGVLEEAKANNGVVPTALYVVVSGGLALLSTMAFWIGRLFTKLYLSEHHLRNDAEERAVMTTTYLALTHEQAASEADRQIILNALFRNSPDGIVKDDGPSDLNLQALVAKALSK